MNVKPKLLSDTIVMTGEAMASYCYLLEMREGLDGKMAYSTSLLFDKDTGKESLDVLKQAADNALRAKFGNKIPSGLRLPWHDGDQKRPDDPAYENKIYLNVKNTREVPVVGPNMDTITDPSQVYSGCYLRAKLAAYAYDYRGTRGVAFGIRSAQKLRDGKALGTTEDADSTFDAVETSSVGSNQDTSYLD